MCVVDSQSECVKRNAVLDIDLEALLSFAPPLIIAASSHTSNAYTTRNTCKTHLTMDPQSSVIVSHSAYTLDSIYAEAIGQLKTLRDSGRLSSSDYDMLTTTKSPQDVLTFVDEAIKKSNAAHPIAKTRIGAVVEPLLQRLERFGAAIDMIVQSLPQIHGMNLIGLVWGGIKFVVVVSQFRDFDRVET